MGTVKQSLSFHPLNFVPSSGKVLFHPQCPLSPPLPCELVGTRRRSDSGDSRERGLRAQAERLGGGQDATFLGRQPRWPHKRVSLWEMGTRMTMTSSSCHPHFLLCPSVPHDDLADFSPGMRKCSCPDEPLLLRGVSTFQGLAGAFPRWFPHMPTRFSQAWAGEVFTLPRVQPRTWY